MSIPVDQLTIGQVLPWAVTFLKYTDDVVNNLPQDESALDWRPADESGGWYLSIRELAMHLADSRHDVLSWITGENVEDRSFVIEYGGTEKPWQFKPASRTEIIASLQSGRTAVEEWLAKPVGVLLETSAAMEAAHEQVLAKLRDTGQETTTREERSPGRIINALLFLIAHEQSHRSVLQGMLRQRGHQVARYA